MPQFNPFQSARKAGQAMVNTDMGKAILIGGGVGAGVLAGVKLLEQLSPQEQSAVIDAAAEAQAEDGEGATTFGVPAASLLAAGLMMESMNRDADRELQSLTDVVVDMDGRDFRDANNIRRI